MVDETNNAARNHSTPRLKLLEGYLVVYKTKLSFYLEYVNYMHNLNPSTFYVDPKLLSIQKYKCSRGIL